MSWLGIIGMVVVVLVLVWIGVEYRRKMMQEKQKSEEGTPSAAQVKELEEDEEAVVYELTDQDVPIITQKERVVVIMVYTPSCGYCKKMMPEFSEAAGNGVSGVTWARLNADNFQGVAQQMGVKAFPTMVVFKDGRPLEPIRGLTKADTLNKKVGALITKSSN